MIGQRFNKLVVISEHAQRKNGSKAFVCQCDCGKTTVIRKDTLKSKSKSCGCEKGNRIHNQSKSEIYSIWKGMRNRCTNKKSKAWQYYGAKGITVCEEWSSFNQFVVDMGPRPSKKHSIERKDTTKGYSKENCKWATIAEQNRNKTSSIFLTYNGKTQSLKDWAKEIGKPYDALHYRFFCGWEHKDIIEKPLKKTTGKGGDSNSLHN